jgi:hypothetical protein
MIAAFPKRDFFKANIVAPGYQPVHLETVRRAELERLTDAWRSLSSVPLPLSHTRTSALSMFHWVMAAAMFTLLFTAFLPKVGVQFDLFALSLNSKDWHEKNNPGAKRLKW